jgi:hypothetical protein
MGMLRTAASTPDTAKGRSLTEQWADPECRRVWTEDNLASLAWLELNHPRTRETAGSCARPCCAITASQS